MTPTRFLNLALRVATGLVATALSAGAAAQWKPVRPVTIIVPWAAGGATDQVTRLAAAELEPALGQKIVVVNEPGAAGSIGTKSAMEAPKDGYTWTAGAAKQLGTYPVLGMLASKLDDFHLYLSVTNVSIVSVNPGSGYQSLPQLLDAMKAKPGQVTVATAGNSSSGHFGNHRRPDDVCSPLIPVYPRTVRSLANQILGPTNTPRLPLPCREASAARARIGAAPSAPRLTATATQRSPSSSS